VKQLNNLIKDIVNRITANLREPDMKVGEYVDGLIPHDSHSIYYAFYALTTEHPLSFQFTHSSLAGTYFLGKCEVELSVVYKSDIRGDELKKKGTVVKVNGADLELFQDERISIRHSFLVKTLVHNNSHDAENVEIFRILNTLSLHYANIHGTSVEGCYIAPFATVDLCTCRNCIVGDFSYVQAGDLSGERIEPGRIWIRQPGVFELNYQHDRNVLDKFISMDANKRPKGVFMDFCESHKAEFEPVYNAAQPEIALEIPDTSFVSHYSVVKGDCAVGENVLVAQRAFIDNSRLGDGSNAQENCYIINSNYEGMNVTAHGGKVINCDLGRKTFTGFNSFLHGTEGARVKVGRNCVIMPHTIIDAVEPIEIPDGSLVWGYIRTQEDLKNNTIALEEFSKRNSLSLGRMSFTGDAEAFVNGFAHRIEHILEENGAYFDGSPETAGHAQKTQEVSYNTVQAYMGGEYKGLCPTMLIKPLTH
jgi:carbonic anhydrase/acetyltransferase-like protein (isoleucine patch superfamily)